MHSVHPRHRRSFRPPVLRFTPYAWAKLLYLRDRGETEIGGFGFSSADDPFLVETIALVQQDCSPVTVRFDDASVADYFENQVLAGRTPAEFARIWIHTHPGLSAEPTGTDEATFERVFGRTDWAAMVILARGGARYARLRFGVGPGGQVRVPVRVDFAEPFPESEQDVWELEYAECVRAHNFHFGARRGEGPPDAPEAGPPAEPHSLRDLADAGFTALDDIHA